VADSSGFSAPPSSPEGSRGFRGCGYASQGTKISIHPPRTMYRYVGIARESCRRSTERVWSRMILVAEAETTWRRRSAVRFHPWTSTKLWTTSGISDRNGDRGFSRAESLGSRGKPTANATSQLFEFQIHKLRGLRLYRPITKSLFLGFFYRKVPSIFAVIMNHRNGRHRYQKGMAVGYPFTKRPSPSAAQIKTARSKSHLLPHRVSPPSYPLCPTSSIPRVSTCSTRLSHSG
jgi:hypothetical protein